MARGVIGYCCYSEMTLLWLWPWKVMRVSSVTKIQSYSDFDVHPYYSHMSKLGNSRLSPNHLLIFASSMPPPMAEERWRQLIVAAPYLVNVIGIRECHGLPWGFSQQPVPVPVKTRTRTQVYGFL